MYTLEETKGKHVFVKYAYSLKIIQSKKIYIYVYKYITNGLAMFNHSFDVQQPH